jgi:hypothetical protein
MSLRLNVNQEERRLVAEAGLYQQIHFVPLPFGYVREYLFVQEFDGIAIEILDELGKEQLQKVNEELRKQFLEQTVVIHRVKPPEDS